MPKRFAWKHIKSGRIGQNIVAKSKDDLFEATGFGAVRVDEPIKGYLAVEIDETGKEKYNRIASDTL